MLDDSKAPPNAMSKTSSLFWSNVENGYHLVMLKSIKPPKKSPETTKNAGNYSPSTQVTSMLNLEQAFNLPGL